jgi:DNA-binding beta-propeller fold protein YncE
MTERTPVTIDRNILRWIVVGIGIVALITAIVALLVTPGNRFTTVSYVALGVGVIGLAGFVLLDPQAIVEALTGRTGQFGMTTALMSLFFVAFVVALFIVIRQAGFAPIDVTEGQQYTLSDASIEVLQNLQEPVHAIAFYSETSSQREEASIWLNQYKQASNGMFDYEFVDPERDPATANQYDLTSAGTIVFEQGDRTAQASFLGERELTSALTRVLLGGRRTVYVTTGHGERDIEGFEDTGFSQIARELQNVNFTLTPLNLLEEGEVPADADAVFVLGPTAQFTSAEIEALDAYTQDGGALMVLSDPATGGGVFGNGVLGVDFDPSGTRVATAGSDGTVRIWDAATGEQLIVLRGHTSEALDAVFLPGGDRIVTAGSDNTVRVWDITTAEEVAQLEGATDLVERLAVSDGAGLIASVGGNQTLNVWDAATLEPVDYSPLTVPAQLRTVAFSPAGALIAASGGTTGSGPVYVWDAASGEMLINQPLHSQTVLGIAFSPDGETLHTAAVDGTEGTIDIETGEGTTTPRFPEIGLSSIAIAPDGTTAYALLDGTIHLRAPDASPEDDLVLAGHEDIIWDVAFSPDGALLASAGRNGEARIWDVETGEATAVLTGHSIADPLITYLETAWGADLADDLVVDVATASEFDELTPIILPSDYAQASPITAPLLENQRPSFFSLARSVAAATGTDLPITFTPLAMTTQFQGQMTSWGETTNPFATGSLEFDEADIPGPVAVALSAENTDTGARLVVFGDADFVANNAMSYTTYGNAQFFISAANWLTEGEDAIELPAPNFDTRQLDRPFTIAGSLLVTIAVTCLVPLVMAAGGLIMWITRRRRR